MSDFGIGNSANNFGRSAGILANTTANRPAQAAEGTLFVDLDLLTLSRYDALGIEPTWQEIGGGGGGIEGASNGLTIDDTDVILGGTLTNQTSIDITAGGLFLTTDSLTEYEFNTQNCFLVTSSEANEVNAALQLQDDGSITLNGNNNTELSFGSILALNILGLGQSRINNTISANNDDIIGTVTYDSYLADENKTQLEHINNFYNDGEYFPVTARFSVRGTPIQSGKGEYNFLNVPTFASNVTALAGGLVVGDIYRVTGTGNLHIVF